MSESAVAAYPIIDANIFLRHLLDDVSEQSDRTHALFAAIELGSVTYETTSTVVFECVYVLESLYRVPRTLIRDRFLPLLGLDHLILPTRRIYREVFDLYVSRRGLSFADCYHAVLVREFGSGQIVSFDRGFDRIPGVTRLEPPLPT